MRVVIASRIFDPEPSAATFRLRALAEACVAAGHEVTVLTVRPPERLAGQEADSKRSYRVRRAPVKRDRSDYVRGYLSYMSFDLPLFFRILFGGRADLIIVEPPPTTGLFVRLTAAIRRIPYVYYAADIWSDASTQTSTPAWVVRVVRAMECTALRGAKLVLSVSDGVTSRLKNLGISTNVTTVGNGIDVEAFGGDPAQPKDPGEHIFLYAGTTSEWHGADVFVRAMPRVLKSHPEAVMLFVGGGSERENLAALAAEMGIDDAVRFEPVQPPSKLGRTLRAATAAIASVRPGAGYDFAFPTKLYSAAACGVPLIYSGSGPAIPFVETLVDGLPLGTAVGADVEDVAAAMIAAADLPFDRERRATVASWAAENVSLAEVASRALRAITRVVGWDSKSPEDEDE